VFDSKDVLNLIATAVATFVGAWAAFQLQKSHDRAKEIKQRLDAGRRAQFALVAQSNVLYTLRTVHLSPLRDHPGRHILLKALTSFQRIPNIDLSSIDFLFDSKDADLLNRLLDCDNKFATVVGNLEQRFAIYTRFQQALAQAERQGFPPQATLDQMEVAVGGEIAGALKSVTDLLYESLDEAIKSNDSCFADLRTRLRALFPGSQVLDRQVEPRFQPPREGNAA